jgi:hypothetical protein
MFGTVRFGIFLCYKYASGADSGHYSVTLNSVGGTAALGADAYTFRVTGGPTSGNPFVDTVRTAGANSGATATVASYTPGGDDSLLIASFFSNDSGSLTGPSGWTKNLDYADIDGSVDFGLFSRAQTTAAATGSLSFSQSGGVGGAGVIIGTIRPPH